MLDLRPFLTSDQVDAAHAVLGRSSQTSAKPSHGQPSVRLHLTSTVDFRTHESKLPDTPVDAGSPGLGRPSHPGFYDVAISCRCWWAERLVAFL